MSALLLSCHCGGVQFRLPGPPPHITQCNCSLCTALGWMCCYYDRSEIERLTPPDREQRYIRSNIDKACLAVHRCAHCGVPTHWEDLDPAKTRMGFNANLIAGLDIDALPMRFLDGAAW